MLTITCVLAFIALGSAVLALMGKCPVPVAVLFVAIVELFQCLPR